MRMNLKIESLVEKLQDARNHKIEPEIEGIKELLSKGCDVDGQDRNGNTLLHHVVMNGIIRMYNSVQEGTYNQPAKKFDAEYLVKNFSPNPLIKNHDGLTPAMLAAKHHQTQLWQMLSSYEQSFVANQVGTIMEEIISHQALHLSARKRVLQAAVKLTGARQRVE